MNIFLYDRTFEGLLSAVFYAYDTKLFPSKITTKALYQEELFAETFPIYTNSEYAQRVWKALVQKTSKEVSQRIYRAYLSELDGIEMKIFKYIKRCFDTNKNIDTDFGDDTVLDLNNISKKVAMEGHRAIMFIRFQKTRDGMYYAPFDPEYNVLPLTIKHFKDRFSDQQWVIYDTRRNYGYYYDLTNVSEITFPESKVNANGKLNKELLDCEELDFQQLWKDYFQSVNIKERKNPKVHKQFLPKRFWKYLPEKNNIEVK